MAMKDRFGINMKQWCRAHEAFLASAPPSEALLALHREKLAILRHERLVHLIVTVMVVFVELFTVDLVLLHPALGVIPAVVMLGLAVLLGFYFYHYFVLENTVQRWYRLADELRAALRSGGT
jgi:flagellar biosynthesis protein FliP